MIKKYTIEKMGKNTPIPCLECDREKYFEGLCYSCNNRKLRKRYQLMTKASICVEAFVLPLRFELGRKISF